MESNLNLFMVLLGGKPKGRHTEQHDVFFGIGETLSDLLPKFLAFWPGVRLHIDAWRQVRQVDGCQVSVLARAPDAMVVETGPRLFFLNLGGYQHGKFEEQHYYVLTAQADKTAAIRAAKSTAFYRSNHIPGGESHIDEKYGIDVDDLFQIEELLSEDEKDRFQLQLTPGSSGPADVFILGYTKLSSL